MFRMLKRKTKKRPDEEDAMELEGQAEQAPAKVGAASTTTTGGPPDEDEGQDVGMEVAELKFMLECSDSLVPNKSDVESALMERIQDHNMVVFYKLACDQGLLKLDSSLVKSMEKSNAKELDALEDRKFDAEENHGEIEVMEAQLKLAKFRSLTGSLEEALAAYDEVAGLKSMSTGQLIDVVLRKVILGFFWGDYSLAKTNLDEAERLMEKGGDWDRRNRLKVYRGLYSMASRDFKKAAEDFLSAVATFTSTELCTYETFIFYTVVTSVLALGRVEFKKQIIDSPEVLSVVREVDSLQEFMNTLHDCDYRGFFVSLVKLNQRLCTDRYIAQHKDWFFREVRVKAYQQFLESYKSVTISSMAKSFGVSVGFLDTELSHFISSNRLNAKIDKVGGVIETSQPNETNARYQSVIKQGDVLLNRVQLLSRAINV
ncbi:26S proteasome non-ATPase regulatory subunit 6-like [Hondaea fermentalgiana]|uniref:26S proteasome non-ATPase regulatory subunit 6-like n=1 Tax=Hondaea fermentalgiana TaxID=2315210 RepID=A0A2R5GP35_9STRA|nr:26S proteasome non-ATPase regulatory subunit 6-like [Hondaea fermentalgiana]|eukprot:GBG31538.1 26S proteasome non-ATPase regulatory subunit 6-like [Hondaea fermentalgiana]